MRKRRIYLEQKPLEEAKKLFFDALAKLGFFQATEAEIDVREALDRVTSRPIFAKRSSPHFRSSAMDGIAVRAEQTVSARNDKPLRLKRGVDFEYVDTGQRIPDGFDAVVMIERVNVIDEDTVEIREAVFPGKHVRDVGEDFKESDLVLPENAKIAPEAIAALLNTGNLKVHVKRKPKCVYIPVGSELVPADGELSGDQVPESNSQMFKGYIQKWGGEAHVWPIVKNETALMKEALAQAVKEFDLIAIGAGTSKGREDLTATVVAELGQILVHGVAYHPGHPILLGLLEGGKPKPVIGLPGYAVACWLGLMQFVRPLFEKYFKVALSRETTVKGVLARNINSILNAREFVRVKLEKTERGYLVYPLPGGASRLSSLIKADGIVEVPEEREGLQKGEEVVVKLLKPLVR